MLTNRVQEAFDELIGEDTDKNWFIRALTRIFALLLNTKVNTANEIKKALKISLNVESNCLLRRGRRQRIKPIYPYKIKLTLSEQKQVESRH